MCLVQITVGLSLLIDPLEGGWSSRACQRLQCDQERPSKLGKVERPTEGLDWSTEGFSFVCHAGVQTQCFLSCSGAPPLSYTQNPKAFDFYRGGDGDIDSLVT
ncbi:hypothetical protein APTSU1_000749800 [Apodemus speciosus]|uniref:Uncharacterized protein n=1 Tax=Apodemus speciosus TaxID=105296 RepID=A0ABQ0EZE3_APOSI